MSTQNVIEGILSQKIVQSGSGYAVKTDIKNIDTLQMSSDSTQAGTFTITNTTVIDPSNPLIFTLPVPGVTPTSIVIVTYTKSPSDTYMIDYACIKNGVKVRTNQGVSAGEEFCYFVAKY